MVRSLLLVAAAFAAGLLAGTLVWTGDDDAQVRTIRATAPGASPDVGAPPVRSGIDDPARTDAPASAARAALGANPGVYELAREAGGEIERVIEAGLPGTVITGDGRLDGTVRDPEGDPVSGAVVTATPESQPAALYGRAARANERPHLDADLRDVAGDAIQKELWRRRVRRTVTTGADGGYELTGLGDQPYRVTAFHERFEIQPVSRQNRVTPDATVDFLAQPVVPVRVEVRLPDGPLAENAWLSWEGPHGRGWGIWTPDEPELRIAVGACKVTATTQTPEPMQSEPVERTFDAQGAAEPLVIVLAARRILTARLVMPEGFAPPDNVEFRIRAVAGTDDVDPATLDSGSKGNNQRNPNPGSAAWYDLEPGRYLIAAFAERQHLIAHAVGELGEGSAEIGLPVPDPADRAHLAVKLIGADGTPPAGRAWFQLEVKAGERSQNLRPIALRRPDGVWFLVLEDLEPKPEGEAVLRVSVADVGSAQKSCRVGGASSVTIRFDEPASLRVRVDDVAGSPVAGRLQVYLRGDEAWGGGRAVEADGTCEVKPLQPGAYRLQLAVRDGNRTWSLHQQRLTLRPGEQEVRVAVPPLHTLRVRPARELRARSVVLTCDDEGIGPFRLDARVDGDGIATFEALAAGSYRMQCGRKQVAVRVPGPELVEVE